jgi:hypothetical protein
MSHNTSTCSIGAWAGFTGFVVLAAISQQSFAQTNITTGNGDNYRTNANLMETQLTPRTVRPGLFGKLGYFPADGQVYAQPLLVSNLGLPDGTVHDVLYVATMHNSVYAYDARVPSAAGLLWTTNLGPSFPVSLWNSSYTDVSPEVGILGTGAIDLGAGVLYVVSEVLEKGSAAFYLHALDLTTGAERMNGPVVISAALTGSGAGSVAGQLVFDPNQHIQRPGLLALNGSVYVGFGSHMDQSPWHGWIMSYDGSDLTVQRGIFVTSPNGEGAAIWHSGRGLAADDAGNVYAMTGNGDFDGSGDFGESFLKFSGPNLSLADWFTPSDWQSLSDIDADLSTGAAVMPGTHNLVGGDKYGQLYLVNGDSMGGLNSSNGPSPQTFTGAVIGGMFNFALWSQPEVSYVYVQGEGDVVKSYALTNGAYDTTPASAGSSEVDQARVGMTISANRSRNGILWETTGDFNEPSVPGTLHAFDASNLAVELWNSDLNSGQDSLGGLAKFSNPTVANGRVYVGTTSGGVVVYGLACSGSIRPGGHCDSGPAVSTQ